MARKRKSSPVEDLIEIAAHLSWKIGLSAALLSYLVFHYLSTLPQIAGSIEAKTIGEMVSRQVIITGSTVLQYIVPFALLVGVAVGIYRRQQRTQLLETRSGIESIREMSWQNFELLVGEVFKRQGYEIEERGGAGADGGIDLILHKQGKKTLVQCKRWKTLSIGVSHIRELYGVMTAERADSCIFVSSGAYTPDALAFAQGKPMKLIDGAELVGLINGVQTSGYIQASARPAPAQAHYNETACPMCGSHMVLRKARKGANAGNDFWGCSKYPGCRGVRNA